MLRGDTSTIYHPKELKEQQANDSALVVLGPHRSRGW